MYAYLYTYIHTSIAHLAQDVIWRQPASNPICLSIYQSIYTHTYTYR